MRQIKHLIVVLIFLAAINSGFVKEALGEEGANAALSQNDLQEQIRNKSKELEAIEKQIETTEKYLKETQTQKSSLEKDLKTFEYTINQLNLNIKADEIAIQKLKLEIDSLKYDLSDIEVSVENKKGTIAHILRELQRNNEANLLMIFLKNDSLAEGVSEAQALVNLKNQLLIDIANLENLRQDFKEKVDRVSEKKSQLEIRQENLKNRKIILGEQKKEKQIVLAQTKNKESLYEKQIAELKKQQEEIVEEISKIEDQLRASFDPSLLPGKRHGVLLWPIKLASDGGVGRITQHFGEISYLYRGKPHNGLDIGAPIGTPVFAADDGVVAEVGNNDRSAWRKYQYGKYILIQHNNNLATLYAHLSKQVVLKGMQVKRGDLIGYSGNTGFVTGPHLHFTLYWAPSVIMKSIPPAAGLVPVGVAINPEDYL